MEILLFSYVAITLFFGVWVIYDLEKSNLPWLIKLILLALSATPIGFAYLLMSVQSKINGLQSELRKLRGEE